MRITKKAGLGDCLKVGMVLAYVEPLSEYPKFESREEAAKWFWTRVANDATCGRVVRQTDSYVVIQDLAGDEHRFLIEHVILAMRE